MMAMLHYGMLSAELTHSVVQVHVKQVQWEASAVRGGNKLQGLDEDRFKRLLRVDSITVA